MQEHFEKVIGRLRSLEGLVERLQTVESGGGGVGGWTETSGWSYASATTITVPSGAASIYAVGDQIRLKQGGAYKYFSVIAVADTTLTVTGGSDYTVANAAITDAAFSKGGGVGHPGWFNWTPAYQGHASMTYTSVTTSISKFSLVGRMCTILLRATGTTGGTASNRLYASLPINARHGDLNAACFIADGTAAGDQNAGFISTEVSGSLRFSKYNNGNLGLGTGRSIGCSFSYEIVD